MVAVDETVILNYEARIKELEAENAALKRQQVEINTAKELYLKIFEDFPALIWRSRLDKLCDYFNKTWLKWTGKSIEQEFGHGWANGVHPDDFDRCLETYVKAFDKRQHFYMEYRLLNKRGEYRWIGDHGTPFYDLDGTTFLGYIGSCYDITNVKLQEQELRKLNATKDKFFSIVAHDLRNPISAFVSVSELLLSGDFSSSKEELQDIASLMHKDAKNTLLLLENLLEWSKSQSNDIPYNPEPIVLPQLCKQVSSQVDSCAKAKKITVQLKHIDTDDDDDLVIQADANMLTTVLRNLLMNAIKFTHRGGQIDFSAVRDGPQHVLIAVQDNGVGMPPEQLTTLFALVKNRKSRLGTDKESGSGLGLVICQDFVQKHGGKIWAESTVGQGTAFKVRLPISAPPTPLAEIPNIQPHNPDSNKNNDCDDDDRQQEAVKAVPLGMNQQTENMF